MTYTVRKRESWAWHWAEQSFDSKSELDWYISLLHRLGGYVYTVSEKEQPHTSRRRQTAPAGNTNQTRLFE